MFLIAPKVAPISHWCPLCGALSLGGFGNNSIDVPRLNQALDSALKHFQTSNAKAPAHAAGAL